MIKIKNAIRYGLNLFRFSYVGSRITNFLLFPLYRLSSRLSVTLQKKIKFNGQSVLFNEIPIVFPPNVGMGILSNIKLKGSNGFEPFTSKVLLLLSKKATVFFDIGSNFGIYSVLLKKGRFDLDVYSFEPIKELFESNKRFQADNGITSQIFNMGLSDAAGSYEIQVPILNSPQEVLSASLESDFAYNKQFETRKEIISLATLDGIVKEQLRLSESDKCLLKIDVEGHEVNVLRGGIAFIEKNKPWIVCEVDHRGSKKKELCSLLEQLEYQVYAITNLGLILLAWTEFLDFHLVNDFLFSKELLKGGKHVIDFEEL